MAHELTLVSQQRVLPQGPAGTRLGRGLRIVPEGYASEREAERAASAIVRAEFPLAGSAVTQSAGFPSCSAPATRAGSTGPAQAIQATKRAAWHGAHRSKWKVARRHSGNQRWHWGRPEGLGREHSRRTCNHDRSEWERRRPWFRGRLRTPHQPRGATGQKRDSGLGMGPDRRCGRPRHRRALCLGCMRICGACRVDGRLYAPVRGQQHNQHDERRCQHNI